MLDCFADFVSRELEVDGFRISVELVQHDYTDDTLITLLKAAGVQLFNPDSTIRKPEEIGKDIVAYLWGKAKHEGLR